MLSRWSLPLLGLVALAGAAAACEGLSPGDAFSSDTAGGCTLGFLLAAPDGLYFSTAGHCVNVNDSVTSPGVSDWGVGAFHFLEPETGQPNDGSPGFDFGLIRVKPSAYAELNPKICGWNGPTGIYRDSPGAGGVKHWGHGMVFGDLGETGQRREGHMLTNDGTAFYWTGAGVPGDSGSAVIADDGRALGILTHLNVGVADGHAVTNGGTHLDRGFAVAAEAGFTRLRLVLMDEDPLKVLQEMRGSAPPTNSPTPASPTKATPGPASPSPRPTTPPSASPTQPTSAAEDPVAPAATGEDEPGAARDTPLAPVAVVVALVSLAALARRRKA